MDQIYPHELLRPKYYKQPNLTADKSAEEDIICIDSTSEPKHSQARQVHTELNQESTLKHNKILVQAEEHADKNGVPCIPLTNTFHHQRLERKRLQRGRLSQPHKIKAAFHNRRRYLIYVGKLNKQTSEDALRYHIDIGLQQTDIADVKISMNLLSVCLLMMNLQKLCYYLLDNGLMEPGLGHFIHLVKESRILPDS